LIYATVGEHETAVEHFKKAIKLDQYLAVAYFQCGVSNFLLENYVEAHQNFEEALLYLRGNRFINYEQLGLNFRLFSAEVLFNKGLSLVYMRRLQEGLADMEEGRREKATPEHDVIDDAIRERAEGYTVFSIPVGVLYRPSEKKLKNSVTRDYMGKAKLVASSDPNDEETSFSGAARLKLGISPAGLFIDPDPLDNISSPNLLRSATVAPVMSPRQIDMPRSAGVERSKTSYLPTANTLDSDFIKLISPRMAEPMSAGLTRKQTQITPSRPSPNATIGGQLLSRDSSKRRPGAISAQSPKDEMAEFYDDYLGSYDQGYSPPVTSPDRASSTRSPASQYSRSMKRMNSSRSNPRAFVRGRNNYDEEGYGSEEYDEGPFELAMIRVKLHYQDDIRGMTLTPDTPFPDFMDKVMAKFYKEAHGLYLKFKDEDGGKVSLRDESDYELAIETARESAKGKAEGKLEIWCIDT
jgi:neutrophil cytosolic factor 2